MEKIYSDNITMDSSAFVLLSDYAPHIYLVLIIRELQTSNSTIVCFFAT